MPPKIGAKRDDDTANHEPQGPDPPPATMRGHCTKTLTNITTGIVAVALIAIGGILIGQNSAKSTNTAQTFTAQPAPTVTIQPARAAYAAQLQTRHKP